MSLIENISRYHHKRFLRDMEHHLDGRYVTLALLEIQAGILPSHSCT